MGIEPTISRWQREVLPLNYADNFTTGAFKPLLRRESHFSALNNSSGVLWFRANLVSCDTPIG